LINTKELNELLRDSRKKVIVIGVIPLWRFLIQHIPGSHQVWRNQLTEPGSAKLIDAKGFTCWAQRLGIHPESHVVLWDERYDATRLWWAFQHYGKYDVQVLDGGLEAWKQAKLPLARGPVRRISHQYPGRFTTRITNRFPIGETHDILATKNQLDSQLWDCRSFNEWSGRTQLRGARKAGRIPWAKHLPWQLFRAEPCKGSHFFEAQIVEDVISIYNLDKNRKQFFYCQSGVRTTVAIFALYQLGWEPEKLINFDGSWREWSRDATLPFAKEPPRFIDLLKRCQHIVYLWRHAQRSRPTHRRRRNNTKSSKRN
jgi:thiosulfate/3-mercaptopyruvate sulfurtransferase